MVVDPQGVGGIAQGQFTVLLTFALAVVWDAAHFAEAEDTCVSPAVALVGAQIQPVRKRRFRCVWGRV